MSKLDLETRDVPEFEDEGYEATEEPLHVKAARLLSKMSLLWSHRRRIFAWTFGSTVVTLGLMFLVPNQYRAVAILNPPDMNPMSGMTLMIGMKSGIASGLSSTMGDMLGMKSQGQIYIHQMQSRVVLDAIVRRFDLQKVFKTAKPEDARKVLLGMCEFTEDKKSGVIEIDVLDEDPNRAARIANAFGEELGNLQAEMNAQTGRLERQYFESQLLQAKEDFRRASDELSNYGGQKGAMDVESEGKALADAVGAIEGQLIATRTELKGLQQIYTENNIQITQTRARIAQLEAELAKVSSGSQAQARKSAGKGESQPATDLSIQRMWGNATPYMSKYGDVKIQEAIVTTLAEQYEIAKLEEAHHVSNVQIMDPAQPPQKKYKPHRATMAVIAGFLVFVFLVSRILIEEMWNSIPADDPWRLLFEPYLSVLHRKLSWWKFWQRRTKAKEPEAASGAV